MAADRRVIVLSDLHMGGAPTISKRHPFEDSRQVFHSAAELAAFLDGLDETHAGTSGTDLELILNGDSIDFRTEGPFDAAASATPQAVARLEAALDRVPEVCSALDRFLASHSLTVAQMLEVLQPELASHGDRSRLADNDLERLLRLLQRKLQGNRSSEAGADAYQSAAESLLRDDGTDLVVFGHTRQALRVTLPGGTYMNTGAWAHRLSIPDACLAGTQDALDQFRSYVGCLLHGTFEPWTSAQRAYADIRLAASGEVVTAELCEFKGAPLPGDRLPLPARP